NGISSLNLPPRDEVRADLELAPDDVVVGFVGRLASQKAPDVMLDAFAAAVKKCSKLKLVMVGDGPLGEDCRARVRQAGLQEHVQMLGDVVATNIMPAFDMFCLSSHYEAMPYVLLEALAAGLPIVATQVGGTTMCVESQGNGQIVPPGNAAALADSLAQLG